MDRAIRIARRVVVAIVGGSVVLIGLALIVLPGPAFLVIPVGLSILALEFAFARRWLRAVRRRVGLESEAAESSSHPGSSDAARADPPVREGDGARAGPG